MRLSKRAQHAPTSPQPLKTSSLLPTLQRSQHPSAHHLPLHRPTTTLINPRTIMNDFPMQPPGPPQPPPHPSHAPLILDADVLAAFLQALETRIALQRARLNTLCSDRQSQWIGFTSDRMKIVRGKWRDELRDSLEGWVWRIERTKVCFLTCMAEGGRGVEGGADRTLGRGPGCGGCAYAVVLRAVEIE